jgi:20S proteasome alpha/beta subunit
MNQIDYANKAAAKGGTILGIRSKDFSVSFSLRNRKQSSVLSQPSKVRKLTSYYGIGAAGILSDANYLSNSMFDMVLSHQTKFDSDPPMARVASHIATIIHSNTMVSSRRPFGVSLCLFGFDDSSQCARLFEIDPAGGCHDCRLCCIGQSNVLQH